MTIKSTLEECSMVDVWENQTFGSVNMLTNNNLNIQF